MFIPRANQIKSNQIFEGNMVAQKEKRERKKEK